MNNAKKILSIIIFFALLSYLAGPTRIMAGESQPLYSPDDLIVKFRTGVDPDKIAAKHGLKVSKKNEKLGVGKLKLSKGDDLKAKMAKLKADPGVSYVELNYYAGIDAAPNDPSYNLQWGISKIKADQAWNTTTGDPSLKVAILDTGVDTDHPDLAGHLLAGHNPIDSYNNAANIEDDHGHGTHVAGIAAGIINNGAGIAGVAGNCKILPVKVLGANGSGLYSDFGEGIIWAADNGARVINMSLGGDTFSQYLQDCVDYAYNKGAIVIAAAGNKNTSAKHYPAALNHVVAVSATDQNNLKAVFSNYGTHIDVAAPGTSIYSTTYDGLYSYKQGTSMATPFVSGVAALVLSERPALTPGQLERILQTSATDIGTAGKDNYFGYGLIDALEALTEPVDTSAVGLLLIGDSPDPFGPTGSSTTKITYSIPVNAKITLRVYNSFGNLVRTVLYSSPQNAGTRIASWNGKNSSNVIVPEGVYTYKIQAEDYSGNLSSELSGTITVDRTLPTIGGITVDDNPFEPDGANSTSIAYHLSEPSKITIKIYNSSNVLVNTIANAVYQAAGGLSSVAWNGKNSKGVLVGDGTYTVKIDAVDNANWKAVQQKTTVTVEGSNPSVTAVTDAPDPFKATGSTKTTIKYILSENATVSIRVYDSNNEMVKVLMDGLVTAGAKSVTWDAKNTGGTLVPSGVYTYKIDATDTAGKTATQVTGTTSVDSIPPVISDDSTDPNPYHPDGTNTSTISYTISENSKITVAIYSNSNVLIKTLYSNIPKVQGANTASWDGKNAKALTVTAGTYKYRITAVDSVGFKTVKEGTITVN